MIAATSLIVLIAGFLSIKEPEDSDIITSN
jgi:hypothetical protein